MIKLRKGFCLKYLILLPKWDNVKRVLFSCGKEAVLPFDVRGFKTTLIVKKSKKFEWTFITNIELKRVEKYISIYRRRWNVETGFRVQDEGRILTKSLFIQTRYFYFLIPMILYNEWKSVPEKCRETLKST